MKSKIPSDESQTKDGRMEKTGVDGVFAVLGRLFFLLMFVAVFFNESTADSDARYTASCRMDG